MLEIIENHFILDLILWGLENQSYDKETCLFCIISLLIITSKSSPTLSAFSEVNQNISSPYKNELSFLEPPV